MHFSVWETLLRKIILITFVLIFMQIQIHGTTSLRLSPKCPYGNYFTDGCVSCWCEPEDGQRVCENMITCPRKGVKCPMGRTYQDECSNDCTCYENTGAIFCKEKGPCNSVKRRNVPPPPPPPPLPPTPHLVDFVDRERSSSSTPKYRKSDHLLHIEDNFHIPSSVPLHKEDLIIEPALIIRRKTKGRHGVSEEKKKHPTTLLYLYEKQLKSMNEFKNHYKHYINSHDQEMEDIGGGGIIMRDQNVDNREDHHDSNFGDTSIFSESNIKTKYSPHKPKPYDNRLEIEFPRKKTLPQKGTKPRQDVIQSFSNNNNQLEIEIPFRNFKIASSSSRPPHDFHYIFKNMKQNKEDGRKYLISDDPFGSTPARKPSSNSTFYGKQNIKEIEYSKHSYSTTFRTTPRPHKKLESSDPPIATVYNVISTTIRPDFNNFGNPFPSSSTTLPHNFLSGSTPRPQFISYVTPKNRTTQQATQRPSPPTFNDFNYSTTTPRPLQREYQYPLSDQKTSPSSTSIERYNVRAEVNKPIFVNHIVATRRFPEIYMTNKHKNHHQHGNNNNPPIYYHPQPLPPPPTQRPTQYRLYLKNMDKKPHFISDRNRVPLFVDKIAREFFRKPAIFVPKINTVGGKKELQLNRVVYNHKEMIPKELVLEPGGPPMKVKFTPEAEREMNQEWLDALREQQKGMKMQQSLGYHQQQSYHYQDFNDHLGDYSQISNSKYDQNSKSYINQQNQQHNYQQNTPLSPQYVQHQPKYQQNTPLPPQQNQQHNYQQNTPLSPQYVQHQPKYQQNTPLPPQHVQHQPNYQTHNTYQNNLVQHPSQNYPQQQQQQQYYTSYFDGNYASSQNKQEAIQTPYRETLPIPNPIQIPPYAAKNEHQFPPNGFRPGPPYEEEESAVYPSPETPPMDYPVIEQPPPQPHYDSHPHPSDSVVIMEQSTVQNNDHHYNPPPTVTEAEADYIPVSPRPDDFSHSSTPLDFDEFGFPSESPPEYSFSDMLPQASSDLDDDHDDSRTILIDSFKKAEEVPQQNEEQEHQGSANRPRISIQDVLAHKRGQHQHIRIKSSDFTTTTTTPRPTPPPPSFTTTEEFNPEKVLREILAMDPDIGLDAILFKENGETIPPLSSTTTTTTTPLPPLPNLPFIKSKGDVGILPQDFDPEPQIYLTSTTTPNPNRSNEPVLSFEQFYQDLFRPQKKREEVVKPDGIVDANGVAKIFRYDSIIKTFKSGDSSEESSSKGGHKRRNLDKRDHEKDDDKKRSSSRNSKKRKENGGENETKLLSPTTTTRKPTPTEPPTTAEKKGGDNPDSSFKRELDWKSNLMADICSVNPESALCFTYKSLCLLMTSR
ncbi:hypothetical protein Fcan01_04267 [Folsomia candida]|uniref:Uncharacterized protein n=1 Tax=Folsomia candida TaxID=158441 RepID=A0A226ERN4_FOLCA|nr:hypothetical protein Fcan01_04267 [Folsomia candida]